MKITGGSCANPKYDPEWWVVSNALPVAFNAKAVSICKSCPVKESCAEEASASPLEMMRYTIWAGRRWDVKDVLCRGCGQEPKDGRLRSDAFCGTVCRQAALCGTTEGYSSHMVWRTVPCDRCCEVSGRAKPVLPEKKCGYCGERFQVVPRARSQEYCSVLCRGRMQTHIRNMKQKVMAIKAVEPEIEVSYTHGMEVQCKNETCHNTFVYSKSHPGRRYCGRACGSLAQRMQAREATRRSRELIS